MGAIIFNRADRPLPVPDGLTVVRLTSELSMLPITAGQARRLDPAVGDERIPSQWMLRQPVAALARSLSADRAVVYICSETFGGEDTKGGHRVAFRAAALFVLPYHRFIEPPASPQNREAIWSPGPARSLSCANTAL
jgi:hypothetical protein